MASKLPYANHMKAFGLGIVIAVAGIFAYLYFTSTSGPDELPDVTVYQNPTCECCTDWAEYMEQEGFNVELEVVESTRPVREDLGVPEALGSCHTALVGDHVVEGHVPAEDVKRMLVDEREIHGVAVPGMPVGSPGMERGDRVDAYNVIAFNRQGQTEVYAQYGD